MNANTHKKGNVVWIVIAVIAIAIVGFIIYAAMVDNDMDPINSNDTDNDVEWATYRNEEFGFEIDYPSDWTVAEMPDEFISPMFNFYPGDVTVNLPLTHHSNVEHVSVFPGGIPTEGVFGETVESEIAFVESVDEANDFVLEDGTVWATFASFLTTPESWTQSGFVWARAEIDQFEAVCFEDNQEIPIEECELMDPEVDHEIVYRGEVVERSRNIQTTMLESFRFTGNGEEEADATGGGNPNTEDNSSTDNTKA